MTVAFSIIICSRQKEISKELEQNIASSIGIDYELIVIDNSGDNYSLFSAYNEGVRRSNGEILCFCHEDILFHSDGWGTAVREILSDESIGALGVIGTHFLPNAPMYWWSSPFISQYSLNNDKGKVTLNDTRDNFHGNIADVVAVDGVCFFIPRSLFSTIRFDDQAYSGFHVYDMDICMQILHCGKRVCVTDALTIEHFWSEDSIRNRKYMAQLDENLNIFHRKWSGMLPIVRGLDEPENVIKRLDGLCIQAYDSVRVRKSKAYRLGKILLKPFSL
jgi:glycosyltransferase involved in cell wall biosynthesis